MTEIAAWSNAGGSGTNAALAYAKAFPGFKTLRTFSSTLPASVENTEAKGAHAAGIRLVASCKPPKVPTAVSNVTLDRWLGSLHDNDLATNWHEPENDMDGPTFRRMIGNLVDRRNAVKSNVKVGYAAMAYQYLPGKAVKTPGDYYDPRLDWLGCDVYFDPWEFPLASASVSTLSLDNNRGFQRWYQWAKTTGKTLCINELGISAAYPDALRAQAYANAFQWAADRNFLLVSPWNDAVDSNPGTPLGPYNYWGGPTAHPLTEQVVRTWTARNVILTPPSTPTPTPPPPLPPTPTPMPTPTPVPPPASSGTPWAVPITPDPTDRIRALQADLAVSVDGREGNETLSAIEAAVAERDVLRKRVAAVESALTQAVASLQAAEATLNGTA